MSIFSRIKTADGDLQTISLFTIQIRKIRIRKNPYLHTFHVVRCTMTETCLKSYQMHTFHVVRCTMTETCLKSYQASVMDYFVKISDD